jgi:DNA-binding XRE family transcriptional regulator
MMSPVLGRNASNVIPHQPLLLGTLDSSSKHHPSLDVSSRFGVRLRKLRKEKNLTQLQMAVNFGIDRTFISDVERGRKSMSLPMLEIVALGFKLSLSDLLKDI